MRHPKQRLEEMDFTEYRGIDYGCGRTNIDTETMIRFGVISVNALAHWVWDSIEADYGEPSCPQCGSKVEDYNEAVEKIENGEVEGISDEGELSNYHEHSCSDFVCTTCGIILGSDEVTGDEPIGHTLDTDGYKGLVDDHNDLMLVKSPYYTYAQFCSPCAPGAGHLENPCFRKVQCRFPKSKKSRIRKKWEKREENYKLVPHGPRTYCLGHDWFEGGIAPYHVFRVSDDRRVEPKET